MVTYEISVSKTKQANVPPSDWALINPINVIISKNTIHNKIFIPFILSFLFLSIIL